MRSRLLLRCGLLLRTLAASSASATSTAEKLHVLSDNLETTALLSGSLVLPTLHLQAAFNIHRPAFGKILRREFRLPTPSRHIKESRLFLTRPLIVVPLPIDRHPKIGHGRALRSLAQFEISNHVADQHYLVEIRHNFPSNLPRLPAAPRKIYLRFPEAYLRKAAGSAASGRSCPT